MSRRDSIHGDKVYLLAFNFIPVFPVLYRGELRIFSYLGKYGDYQTVNPLITSIIIIIVQMVPLETLHFHP